MSRVYVIMKQHQSPIFITQPKVHGFCSTVKIAREKVKHLNSKFGKYCYWYASAKNIDS